MADKYCLHTQKEILSQFIHVGLRLTWKYFGMVLRSLLVPPKAPLMRNTSRSFCSSSVISGADILYHPLPLVFTLSLWNIATMINKLIVVLRKLNTTVNVF